MASTPSPSLPQLLREALPTSRHARMLFDMVADHLGPRGYVETQGAATWFRIFLREGEGSPAYVPWPLLTLSVVAPEVIDLEVSGGDFGGLTPAPERPPRPGRIPRLRNLGPGEVTIHDGPTYLRVAYGEDGRWHETSQSRETTSLAPLREALATGGATAAELLAPWVAALPLARHGAGRLHSPVATPGGVSGAYAVGLAALREALFHGRIPREATWAVADGVLGTAIAWGATRGEAEEAWAGEVARVRPALPPPEPGTLPSFDPTGTSEGTLSAEPGDAEPIPLTPRTTPRVTVHLGAVPDQRPPVGAWLRMLSTWGEGRLAAIRHEPRGFTLLGDLVLSRANLADLDQRLASLSLQAHAEVFPDTRDLTPAYDTRVVTVRVVDAATGAEVPPHIQTCTLGPGYSVRGLDPDGLRGQVLRLRRVDPQDPWRP